MKQQRHSELVTDVKMSDDSIKTLVSILDKQILAIKMKRERNRETLGEVATSQRDLKRLGSELQSTRSHLMNEVNARKVADKAKS